MSTVDDMELFHEEVMGLPFLMRIWTEYNHSEYIGAAHERPHFESWWEGSFWFCDCESRSGVVVVKVVLELLWEEE